MTEQQRVKFLAEYSDAAQQIREVISGDRDERAIELAEAKVSRLMLEAQKAGITPEELRTAIKETK